MHPQQQLAVCALSCSRRCRDTRCHGRALRAILLLLLLLLLQLPTLDDGGHGDLVASRGHCTSRGRPQWLTIGSNG